MSAQSKSGDPTSTSKAESSVEYVDAVIIGAGVIGAALAQRLAAKGQIVIVLEKFERVAEGVTSRNSGVIHSGIYYPPDSLKAKLCIRGKQLLYEWVSKKSVPHAKIGKAIVATHPAEEDELESITDNAFQSGATGLVRWGTNQLRAAVPEIRGGTSALFASETGIIDPFLFARSLLDDAEENGAYVLTQACVNAIERTNRGYLLNTTRGAIGATCVFNAAGLHSDEVAKLAGTGPYRIHPCRGDYFRFTAPFSLNHLVYPVKTKGASGLGIHVTLDLSGGMRLGPDAEYVATKEDFGPREDKLELFRRAAEKLFGPIGVDQLAYDQCGLRPKLRSPIDALEKDFVISEDLPGFINLVGIESPGLTASMAIAEYCERFW